MPYFAYLSVLHLRETFGDRSPGLGERMRTHYAEADNELHHLLIMESLGGNSSIVDRTIAQVRARRFGTWLCRVARRVRRDAAECGAAWQGVAGRREVRRRSLDLPHPYP